MNRQDYYNTVTLQVNSLPELAVIQAENCFSTAKLDAILPREQFAALERVVLTGCGDSYSAAGAMRAAFAALSGISATFAPDPMDYTAFWTNQKITGGRAALTVAISASGSSERIVKILECSKDAGARTMLISNNPESKGAKAAELFYATETPELCNTPGLRSYFANMVAIVALGTHIGRCKGLLSDDRFEEIKRVTGAYVSSYRECLEEIDDLVFNLSVKWRDFTRFDIVGDGPDYFTAQFVEEKFIECAGTQCSHTDAEDWCHIPFFLKEPQTIGTIFHAFRSQPDYNRVLESANSAAALGRPVLLVTDNVSSLTDERITVCRLPAPPEGYEWLLPLVSFIPGSLAGGIHRSGGREAVFWRKV